MRLVTLKSGYLASLILVAVLVSALFTSVFVGAIGETVIDEDSLILSDGSNPMLSNLNMSQNEIEFGVFHTGTIAPSSPVEGQWWYNTTSHELYVYNSTAWVSLMP